MIYALLLILQAGASSVTANMDEYRRCVQTNSVRLERAKESAGDTVDAAIATCEEMRVRFRSADLQGRTEDSALTPTDYRSVTFQLWDKVLEIEKRKALIAVFQIRLPHAPNQ